MSSKRIGANVAGCDETYIEFAGNFEQDVSDTLDVSFGESVGTSFPGGQTVLHLFQDEAVMLVNRIDVVEQQRQHFLGHALLFAQLVAEPLAQQKKQKINDEIKRK